MKTLIKTKINRALTLVFFLLMTLSMSELSYSQLTEDWINRYDGTISGEDKVQAMTSDREGNIYVTGYSEGKGTGRDFLTVKYSWEGKEEWTVRFNGFERASGIDDEANAIAVDEEGNVYVTGSSYAGRIGRDFCTIKYNGKGQEQWVSYFSGFSRIEDSDEEATSIAIGDGGNIYVAGNSGVIGAGFEICVVKYDQNGEQLWASKYYEVSSDVSRPVFIKATNSGFVYLAGTIQRLSNGIDYYTAKISKSGELEWDATYNGIGGNLAISDDEVSALALDENGNAYVTGYSYGAGTGKDFCTIKYGYDGREEWVSRTDYSQLQKNIRFEDEAKALAVDVSGNVYVTGKATSSLGGSDYLTVKINAKGETEWKKRFDSESFLYSEDGAEALALDKRGNIYVTGFINGFPPLLNCGNERGKDFCTIKYSPAGSQKWVKEYNGTGALGSNDDVAKGIFVDSKNRIFVMGESMGEESGLDFCLIKYSEYIPLEESESSEKSYRLNDNYPNPFNPTTKISFAIPVSSNVRLSIYDMSGREVAVIVNALLAAGSHQYEWNASQLSSGTYFYKIQAEGFVQTKKMVLIK